jgi:hypothetical protein
MQTTNTFENIVPRKITKNDTPEAYKGSKKRKKSAKSQKPTGFWQKVKDAFS